MSNARFNLLHLNPQNYKTDDDSQDWEGLNFSVLFVRKQWSPDKTELVPDPRKKEEYQKLLAEIGTLIYQDFKTNSQNNIKQSSKTVTESKPCPQDKRKDEVA